MAVRLCLSGWKRQGTDALLPAVLRKTGLMDKYSVPSLLLELGKIKKIELSDGTTITTEATRKQREILKKLGLTA